MTTTDGRSRAIASRNSLHSPERVPSIIPACAPATLTSVQGNPPTRISTGSTSAQSTAVMSPRFGTPGHRAASTFAGFGSTSQCHTVRAPKNASQAMSKPP